MGRKFTPTVAKIAARMSGATAHALDKYTTAYIEPCGGGYRLTLYVRTALEYTCVRESAEMALKAAREWRGT